MIPFLLQRNCSGFDEKFHVCPLLALGNTEDRERGGCNESEFFSYYNLFTEYPIVYSNKSRTSVSGTGDTSK
jgi:hypothetical protein